MPSWRARTFTSRLRIAGEGSFAKVSVLGICNEAWQTGHLIACCRCLLAKFACLSRHPKQHEWRHGNVLGLLSVFLHSGHSASFLVLTGCCTSIMAVNSAELGECRRVTSLDHENLTPVFLMNFGRLWSVRRKNSSTVSEHASTKYVCVCENRDQFGRIICKLQSRLNVRLSQAFR